MKKAIKIFFLIVMNYAGAQVTDTGDKVGIGVTSPNYKLDVNGTGRFSSNLLIGDPAGARTEINTSTNHKIFAPTNIKTIDLDGNYHGGGYVGVYRSDLQQRAVAMLSHTDYNYNSLIVYELRGDATLVEAINLSSFRLNNNIQPNNIMTMPSLKSTIIVGDNYNYKIGQGYGLINKLKTSFENDVYVETGNVGIGTTTPDSKLTVAGNIHAQEVKVTVNAGADFVFHDDYILPSLKSIEKFIKENKHLPDIASEKDMQDNGLFLADMNIKLLQKIEELTLYTIQQEKLIKKLTEVLEDQSTTIKEIQKRLAD